MSRRFLIKQLNIIQPGSGKKFFVNADKFAKKHNRQMRDIFGSNSHGFDLFTEEGDDDLSPPQKIDYVLREGLLGGFSWLDSPEGGDYWERIYVKLQRRADLCKK